jgi:hypothetical protein
MLPTLKRTIRALYVSEADAVQAREQLAAAGFHDVEILTRDHPGGFGERLERLVGRERARHWRGEVERGRVVLAAKVDEMLETQAAEIIDASSLDQFVHDEGRGAGQGPGAPA